jgi:hypothetical protein
MGSSAVLWTSIVIMIMTGFSCGDSNGTRDGAPPEASPDMTRDGGPDASDASGDQDRPLGSDCKSGTECQSTFCVDGVCCQTSSCAECNACNLTGNKGTCSPVAKGAAPSGQCTGDTACGAGQCDGNGQCDYKPLNTVCKTTCNSSKTPNEVTRSTCDSSHACTPGSPTSCGGYKCNTAASDCFKGCTATHAE